MPLSIRHISTTLRPLLALHYQNKARVVRQLGSAPDGLRDQSFLGIVTKGEYSTDIKSWTLVPRWKQIYKNRTPAQRGNLKQRELTEIFSLQAVRRINKNMRFIAGSEYEIFNNLRKKPDPLPSGYLLDGNTLILAAQVSNSSAYLGYSLTSNVGVRWILCNFDRPAASEFFSFISVYAGLGTDPKSHLNAKGATERSFSGPFFLFVRSTKDACSPSGKISI